MNESLTDACPRLDAYMLHRRGALVDQAVMRWQWPMPLKTITVTSRVDGHRLFLCINDGPEVAYGIIRRPGTTGSSYPVIECACQKSVRYLYVFGDRIACRICCDLAWPSETPPWSTASRQLNRERAKLITMELAALRRRQEKLKTVQVRPSSSKSV